MNPLDVKAIVREVKAVALEMGATLLAAGTPITEMPRCEVFNAPAAVAGQPQPETGE